MNRVAYAWFLGLTIGCDSGPKPPAVLQETELKNRVLVEAAEPLDPAAVLFTLHKSELITWKGDVQTKEEMVKRAGTSEEINRTPILLEVEPDAPFSVVRDALYVFTGKPGCVNYSFLVETKSGPGVVVLPMLTGRGHGYQIFDGEVRNVGGEGGEKHVEVVVSPGKNGEINVTEVNFLIPNSTPPLFGDLKGNPPNFAWTGEHLPCGTWTKEMLRTFLSRPDVAALRPYVLFKVSTQEPTSDVIRCLSRLKTIKDIPIVPAIPTK